jgi:acylphosphatase
MERRTYHFSGHVQGVGFRYTTEDIAARFNVKGYVRNLPDGRVELVMEGPPEEMDGVLESLRERLDRFIRKIDLNTAPATGEFREFEIRG